MAKKSQTEEVLSQASHDDTPVYELGYHLVPTLGDETVATAAQKIRSNLGSAEIINDHSPERMTLAYTIERSVQGKREKYESSYFGWIKFAMEREALKAFQESLRGSQEVLRSLIIETVREDIAAPKRAVFTSSRLEGETIKKPEAAVETPVEVSEEELDKSIDALVSPETE